MWELVACVIPRALPHQVAQPLGCAILSWSFLPAAWNLQLTPLWQGCSGTSGALPTPVFQTSLWFSWKVGVHTTSGWREPGNEIPRTQVSAPAVCLCNMGCYLFRQHPRKQEYFPRNANLPVSVRCMLRRLRFWGLDVVSGWQGHLNLRWAPCCWGGNVCGTSKRKGEKWASAVTEQAFSGGSFHIQTCKFACGPNFFLMKNPPKKTRFLLLPTCGIKILLLESLHMRIAVLFQTIAGWNSLGFISGWKFEFTPILTSPRAVNLSRKNMLSCLHCFNLNMAYRCTYWQFTALFNTV